ncbi:glycosyltransferase family 2 protein [Telluria mixta]|uniref:Glycosyltransferase family 2 protein n=1 Tax=Telluria mixta TaxID=34071 RepID=A0ABT2BRI6_9BURK|nr:glycosyltransferase family A protein [Telluria mixta]MCS0627729.1 glycosyltransferase family 2 protein [Telluria mixta]WEM94148.1 glycosyltransferase family A protein [Telluria mixta]
MNSSVTVVIPTFNRKELIFQALDSVAKQTCLPLEVIVVDDCSSDGTVEALRAAHFPFPVLVVAQATNQGPAAARNAGILKASGRYVAFLDSDDVWLPEKLEQQLALLESLPNRDRTVLYAQVRLQRRHEVLLRPLRAKEGGESIAEYVFVNGGYLDQNTIMLPTALARAVMYCGDLRLHEDWDFYIRLEEQGAVFVMVEMALGITYDNSTFGRASAAQPTHSLAMLENWRPRISERAYLGLRARIAPQLRGQAPLRACGFIIDAYRRGAISFWMVVVLIGRLAHPDLRQLAYYIRGKLARTAPAEAH